MRFDDRFFPPSKPRKAKGGIRARTQRGNFGTQWWAKRWIAVLESFDMGTRLQRGRTYARAGQVLNVAIVAGLVTARVQGSRAAPYRVTIRIATLGKATWRKIAEHVASEARFAAKLLSGEMPHEIEEAFAAVGASLFPGALRELHTECSCPDWANPCKHVAATYYLIGEEFDRDPFLLFVLRGSTKAQILAELHDIAPTESCTLAPSETTQLPTRLDAFWDGTFAAPGASGGTPVASKPRKRTLPAFPFWRGTEPLEATLAQIDEAAFAATLAILAEQDSDE